MTFAHFAECSEEVAETIARVAEGSVRLAETSERMAERPEILAEKFARMPGLIAEVAVSIEHFTELVEESTVLSARNLPL